MSVVVGLPWQYDDGGRAAAGYRGEADDCVVRAAAIATGKTYAEVYGALAADMRAGGKVGAKASPRNGVPRRTYDKYLLGLGWVWVPTMQVGQGCTTHLRVGEVPGVGPLVVRVSKHMVAVMDGVVRDTHDCTRGGTRCVYGYFRPPE